MGLGIAGGVVGILSAIIVQLFGAVGASLGEATEDAATTQSAETIMNLAWGAYAFSILGIIGGGFAIAKPRLAAVVLVIATVGVVISISFGAIVAAPLMAIGAILVFFGRKSGQ